MRRCGVIFDMDGVLINSYRPHFESWHRLAAEHGLELTEQQFAATFGQTSRQIIRKLWPGEVDEEQLARWDARKEALYRNGILDEFPEMDGANELLEALHAAGFSLGVGSSGPPENVKVVLNRLKAAHVFIATVNGTEVTHGKPDPEVFLLAAGKLGIEPNRCAVIEDAPAGVQAARSAGMVPIALTGTVGRPRLAGAALVVDSLRELSPELITSLIDAPAP